MDIVRSFTTHRRLLWVGLLVLVLILIATVPLYGGKYQTFLLAFILMYVIMAVAWAMFSGATGYMSLAPAAFFGVGIYVMALLQYELPFPLIIVIGGLASFGLALLVGLVTLRLRGMYFAIFTFGLVMLMQQIFNYLESVRAHIHGRSIIPLDGTMLFYIMLGLVVITVLAVYLIKRSRYGLAMLSIGGNEEAAEHMGVNTTMVKILTFAISTVFMGVAGVVAAPLMIYVNPSIAFNVTYSFLPILMAVFGGMGQLYGPIVGGFVFGYLDATIRVRFFNYFMITFGIILVVVILFLPNGIAGLVPLVRDKLGRRILRLRNGGEGEQHANT